MREQSVLHQRVRPETDLANAELVGGSTREAILPPRIKS